MRFKDVIDVSFFRDRRKRKRKRREFRSMRIPTPMHVQNIDQMMNTKS